MCFYYKAQHHIAPLYKDIKEVILKMNADALLQGKKTAQQTLIPVMKFVQDLVNSTCLQKN